MPKQNRRARVLVVYYSTRTDTDTERDHREFYSFNTVSVTNGNAGDALEVTGSKSWARGEERCAN